jgi:hypothetical protein
MPDIRTRLGQYCDIHRYIHDEEYRVCYFCNEHKFSVYFHERYYNYGFSKCIYCACNECHEYLFGPFRLVDGIIMLKAYESIIEVIKTKASKKPIDYYEAVKIAYTQCEHMRKHFDSPKGINNLNKDNKALWEFTYKIVNGEEKDRAMVVNKNPDNLLVSWILGGMTLNEMLKANNMI